VHAVLDLVDRGCPAELAARILAPLDDRWWSPWATLSAWLERPWSEGSPCTKHSWRPVAPRLTSAPPARRGRRPSEL